MRIVIDLSNLAYICFYGLHYTNSSETQYDREEFLENCHYKIQAIKYHTNATEVSFAKDNLTQRKDLDEEYKANREKIIFPIKKDLIEDLKIRNAKIYEAENKEADDIMATLLKEDKVDCIVSTDQDLLQAIEKGEQLFNPINMSFWTLNKLKDKYHGLNKFENIIYYKSFFGDNSDNIPKVGFRLPKKLIVEKINTCTSINNLVESLKDEKFFSKINTERVFLNYDLIKLDKNCIIKEF